jgi:hypothetical protein
LRAAIGQVTARNTSDGQTGEIKHGTLHAS